jgi:hypothetical protein
MLANKPVRRGVLLRVSNAGLSSPQPLRPIPNWQHAASSIPLDIIRQTSDYLPQDRDDSHLHEKTPAFPMDTVFGRLGTKRPVRDLSG